MSLSITFNFAAPDEAAAFLVSVSNLGVKPETAKDSATDTKDSAKPEKPVKAEKPAASPPPANKKEAAPAASEKPSPSPAPALQAAPETYEKTGLADKIAAYLGNKDGAGYADRRAALVALLTKFSVKKGPELKPEQFAAFGEELDVMVKAADAPEDLG